MRKLVKALALSGLAICAGPLSLEGYAQGYVDLEAERAAKTLPDGTASAGVQPSQKTTVVTDPYGAGPTADYPATSYGVNNATVAAPALRPSQAASVPKGGGSGQNLSHLFYQLQQLQQEVMMLNGKVEEQAHELRKIKAQNLERYVDIDRRLGNAAAGSATATATTTSTNVPVRNKGNDPAVAELPGEGEAYRAAYALVRGKQFAEGVTAFEKFLSDYPGGKYSPNAYYWLGELNLVIKPANLESARQAFMLLLNQYPNNNKIPDALYKLGKVQYTKGNRDKGKEFLDRVINEYGSTNSSAVTLAKGFLRDNY